MGRCEGEGREAGCCAWHPSLLFLLLPLPEDFSFSPLSRQPATQFTPLLISLVLPGPGFLGSEHQGGFDGEVGQMIPTTQAHGHSP